MPAAAASRGEAMIEARNISVTVGRKRIVESVNFSALCGEITAIIGPSGSGKTTLLKALCNDLEFAGEVLVHGRPARDLKPYEAASQRAVLPQASALSFPFTVLEVVRLGLVAGFSGVALSQEASLPEQALARVDLPGFGGRFYQDLSGGEQQRVQLARVLCQVWQPVLHGKGRFLLLDEPVSSLDIRHQIAVMDVARAFAKAGGGVIAILHDLNLTTLYADRVLAMQHGHAVGFGTPQEIIDEATVQQVFGCALQRHVLPGGTNLFAPYAPL